MIRNPLALSGAIALTLAALAACGERGQEDRVEPGAPVEAPAATPAAPAAAPTATPTTAVEFVPMAANANLFEIESSNLAQEKGQAAAVKDVARTIVADHTKLGSDMQAAVQRANLNLAMPTSLDAEHAAKVTELRGLSGADFDRRYLEMQREAHEKAIAAFQAYADGGDNPEIKTVAAGALPRLRAHLDAVNAAMNAPAGTAAPAKK